jgi:hypothetical protein
MRTIFAGALALLIVPTHVSAKGDTVRITINGGDLASPIEITDRDVVAPFNIWSGPGTSPNSPEGLIVNWAAGFADAPRGLPRYEVSFLTTRSEPGTYMVWYAIDPATREGYVYLPGKDEPGYADNVWLILRRVEGHWFHAWSEWEKLSHPLIAKAPKRQ